MKLGELKRYAIKLIDEYSNNANITDDEDIRLKLNDLFNIAQIEMATTLRPIEKVFKFSLPSDEYIAKEDEIYVTIPLPEDFFDIKKLRFYPREKALCNDYYIQAKNLKINRLAFAKYELEYNAYPTIITEETNDEHELEVDLDAQMFLPYYVAADILKSDVSANYTSFEAKYNNKLELLKQKDRNTITINSLYDI